jgi:hypothetical protein
MADGNYPVMGETELDNMVEVDQLVSYKRARSNSAAMIAVGLLIGFALAFLIAWAMVNNNYWLWAQCYTNTLTCGPADYYSNPGQALANGATLDEILAVRPDPDGYLLYNRYPRVSTCVPGPSQTVVIPYPQYCQLLTDDTSDVAELNNGGTLFNRTYTLDSLNGVSVDGVSYPNFGINCAFPADFPVIDINGIIFTHAVPLAKWDIGTTTVDN